jgi:hypothetical protein
MIIVSILGFLAMVAVLLMLAVYQPFHNESVAEGFAVASVDHRLMPECVARSPPAQKLLARLADSQSDAAAELRLLVSKLCCIEADIATPAAGVYRTRNLQFRTSQDLEPAMTLVGRCSRGAVNDRDVELAIDKFSARGKELIKVLFGGCEGATGEFAAVVSQTRASMMRFCVRAQPSLDGPNSVRDVGFWEPRSVGDLADYKGLSAAK